MIDHFHPTLRIVGVAQGGVATNNRCFSLAFEALQTAEESDELISECEGDTFQQPAEEKRCVVSEGKLHAKECADLLIEGKARLQRTIRS